MQSGDTHGASAMTGYPYSEMSLWRVTLDGMNGEVMELQWSEGGRFGTNRSPEKDPD